MISPNVYKLDGANLDNLLSAGYYRLGCVMFTTEQIQLEDELFNVHWLRYNVGLFEENKSITALEKTNGSFSIECVPLRIDDEIERLYSKYRAGIAFDVSNTLQENLFDYSNYNSNLYLFDSYIVKIYDGPKLIAAGVFDNGESSIAGIINFYDPAYKKFSLGKFVMLQKMRFAQQNRKDYYYPGYAVEANPKFDYKFFIGKDCSELYSVAGGIWYPAKQSLAFQHV